MLPECVGTGVDMVDIMDVFALDVYENLIHCLASVDQLVYGVAGTCRTKSRSASASV